MMKRVHAVKALENDLAGVGFVIGLNFSGGQGTRTGDRAVPIVGLSSAERGDFFARLRPGGGVKTMRMGNAANILKRTVQYQMSGCIRTGTQLSFNHFSGIQ